LLNYLIELDHKHFRFFDKNLLDSVEIELEDKIEQFLFFTTLAINILKTVLLNDLIHIVHIILLIYESIKINK
jgi:glycogen synthase